MAATYDNCKCPVSTCYYLVRATIRRLQGAAYGVLTQEDVSEILEVFVDEGSRG